jgi:hypothetical protein
MGDDRTAAGRRAPRGLVGGWPPLLGSHGDQGRSRSRIGHRQALEDPRQRAAAVELAQLTLDQLFPAWERSSVAQRIVRIVSVVWVLTAVAALVFGVATGRAGDLNWFPIFFALTTVGIPFVQSRRLRRTIVLNSHVRDGAD